jgi:bla regulator protein BlaR1
MNEGCFLMNTFIKIISATLVCFALCSCTVTDTISKQASLAAIVKSDGLWLYNITDTSDKVRADSSNEITIPLLSQDGKKIAYTKNSTLYLWQKGNDTVKICDNIVSYCWQQSNNICFSVQSGGLYSYNIAIKEQKTYVSGKENYDNITVDKKGKLYAEKYTTNADNFTYSEGLISYNIASGKSEVVIKGVPQTQDNIGWSPLILKISSDGRYIYVAKYPNSGSLAADGDSLICYDTTSGVSTECKGITILNYADNIFQNPANGNEFAVINVDGREMSTNKDMGIFNTIHQTFSKLSPNGFVAMTPYYSKDGKTILYSASPENTNSTEEWMIQGNQHIYSISTNTKKTTQFTNSKKYFDFSPFFINSGKDIGFFRLEGAAKLSLWTLVKGKEQLVTDGIEIGDSDNYYGHIYLDNVVNILGCT